MINNSNNQISYFLYARKSSESEDKQVASIESQVSELKKLAELHELRIAKIFTESKSAKAPNKREVFSDMIERIYKGEASGIICWKLDRLARNPVDGGTINWMLQNGVIRHIRTFDREYFPTDNVLMMSVEFGMANQFIRDLSSNTKRGLLTKAQKGIFPSKPPIGYLNDRYKPKGEKGIIIDEEKFYIVRKLWDLYLTGEYTVDALHTVAKDKLKLVGLGRNPVQRSVIHKMLTNPFYFGKFKYAGKLWDGTHTPMITKEEFDRAQDILKGRSKPTEKKKHQFPFTGIMRCGECGGFITAEEKIKRQKNGNVHEYIYYRCTKRKGVACTQKYINSQVLDGQILEILKTIEIPTEFKDWAIEVIRANEEKDRQASVSLLEKHRKEYDKCLSQLNNLKDMRINGEISSEEFNIEKEKVLLNKSKIQELIGDLDVSIDQKISNIVEKLEFAENAKKAFENGDLLVKRGILQALGTNWMLTDQKLSIDIEDIFKAVRACAETERNLRKTFEPIKNGFTKKDYAQMYASSPEMGL